MKMQFLNINVLILSLFIMVISCNSKVKTEANKDIKYTHTPFLDYHPKIVRTVGAASGNLSCELEDRDGNLWFSTDGEGVYRFDGKTFSNFTMKDGLCDNNTSSIIQDNAGNILIGTRSGICKYDGKVFSNYFKADSMSKFRIISLLEDRDGDIWFSVLNKGIYKFDGNILSNFLYTYKHPIFGNKEEKMISNILQDKKGNIWFSSFNRGGVWRYNGKILTHFHPSPEYYKFFEDERSNAYSSSETKYVYTSEYITDDMIHSMAEDKHGNIWFATRRHGICKYDGKLFIKFEGNEALAKISPITILEDKKGIIWLGTEDDGVFSFDGKILKNYTTTNGLVNNSVRSILEDKNGNLWFGTRSFGLCRFDGSSFTTFSQATF